MMNKTCIVKEDGGIFFLYDGAKKYLSSIIQPIGTTDAGFAKAIAEDNVLPYLNGKTDDELRSLILADYKVLADQDPFVWGPLDKDDYDDDEQEEYEAEKQEHIDISIDLLDENISKWTREQLILFLNKYAEYGSYGFVEQVGHGAIFDMDEDLDLQTYEFISDCQDCLRYALYEEVDIAEEIEAALLDFGYFLSPDIKAQLEDLHLI